MAASSLGALTAPRPALINWIAASAHAIILLSYIALLTFDPVTTQAIGSEDALIEDLGAAFLLIAACLFAFCYYRSAAQPNAFFGLRVQRNIWFLALALLMLLCFGEETSWGQRIFGWQTPEALAQLNAQHEINVHNLWLFQATNPDGTKKSALELLLNANRIFSIFWLTYCVLIPLLIKFSVRARDIAELFGCPVPSLETGSVFIMNYLVFILIVAFAGLDNETLAGFDELKETNYEFAFIILAFCFASLVVWPRVTVSPQMP